MLRNFMLIFVAACLAASSYAAPQAELHSKSAETVPEGASATGAMHGSANARPQAPPAEDWAKLPVDRTVLKPRLIGASLGKTETPDYTRELIRLEWRAGDPIDIYVIMPKGVEKPRVVLYLYSFPSDIDRFRGDAWCRHTTSKGVAAVGFLSALTGERFRMRPMKDWFIPELQESLGSSVHDVQLILDYLAGRGDLSVDQVGMWGQGSGASIAILSAAADPRIVAIDLLNPWGDWPDWMKTSPLLDEKERATFLSPEFLQKVSALDPVIWLPQLKVRALRLQQIMDDSDTPPPARDKIAAAIPQDHLIQYKDVDAHREAWKKSGLSGWIATELLPPTPPLAPTAVSGPSDSHGAK
jgi:hypothetical protein